MERSNDASPVGYAEPDEHEDEEAALSPEWLSHDEGGGRESLDGASGAMDEGITTAGWRTDVAADDLRVGDLGNSNNWLSHTFGEGSTVAADLEGIREELDSALNTSRFLSGRLTKLTRQLWREKERHLLFRSLIQLKLRAHRRVELRACCLAARRRASVRNLQNVFTMWMMNESRALMAGDSHARAGSTEPDAAISRIAAHLEHLVTGMEGLMGSMASAIMQKVQQASEVTSEIAVLEAAHKEKRKHVKSLEDALAQAREEMERMRHSLEEDDLSTRREAERRTLEEDARREEMQEKLECAQSELHAEQLGRMKILALHSDLEQGLLQIEDALEATTAAQARERRRESERQFDRQREIDRQIAEGREAERASRRLSRDEMISAVRTSSPDGSAVAGTARNESDQVCSQCRKLVASEEAGDDQSVEALLSHSESGSSESDEEMPVEPRSCIDFLRTKHSVLATEPSRAAQDLLNSMQQLESMLAWDDTIQFKAKQAHKQLIMRESLSKIASLEEQHRESRKKVGTGLISYVQALEHLSVRNQRRAFQELLLKADGAEFGPEMIEKLSSARASLSSSSSSLGIIDAARRELEDMWIGTEEEEKESMESRNVCLSHLLARCSALQQGLLMERSWSADQRLKRTNLILLHCVRALAAQPERAAWTTWQLSMTKRGLLDRAHEKARLLVERNGRFEQEACLLAWRSHTEQQRQPGHDRQTLDAAKAQLETIKVTYLGKLSLATALRMQCKRITRFFHRWKASLSARGDRHRRNLLCQRAASRFGNRALAVAFDMWHSSCEEALDEERRSDSLASIALRIINRSVSRAMRRWREQVLAAAASRAVEAVEEERRLAVMKSVVQRFRDAAVTKAFAKWRRDAQDEASRRNVMVRLVLRMQNRLLVGAVDMWRAKAADAVAERAEMERRNAVMARILARLRRICVARAIESWCVLVNTARGAKEYVASTAKYRADGLLLSMLGEWQDTIHGARLESSRSSELAVESSIQDIETRNREAQEYAELLIRQQRIISERHAQSCACAIKRALRLHLERAMEDFVCGVMAEQRAKACALATVTRKQQRRLSRLFHRFRLEAQREGSRYRRAERRIRSWRRKHAFKSFVGGVEASSDQASEEHALELQDLAHRRSIYTPKSTGNDDDDVAVHLDMTNKSESLSPVRRSFASPAGVSSASTMHTRRGSGVPRSPPPVAVMCYFSKWKLACSASTLRRVSRSLRA